MSMTKKQETFVLEQMENYPEAGYGTALECVSWKYEKHEYEFIDIEDEKEYKITKEKILKGAEKFHADIKKGELPGLGLDSSNFFDYTVWDADTCDALVQYAIFGKAIYG